MDRARVTSSRAPSPLLSGGQDLEHEGRGGGGHHRKGRLDADLADDVDLLAALLELGLLEVRGGGEGGREDLLGLNVEPEARELALVALVRVSGLG